jgi:hypothetical protein
MQVSNLIRFVAVVVIASTVLSMADVTLGIGIVDQAIDLLDVRQYIQQYR